MAYEIVGVEAVAVPGDGSIETVVGARPPATFSIDDVARIFVNPDGEVERLVTGRYPRRVVLPHAGSR
jgi:hypothetical protein